MSTPLVELEIIRDNRHFDRGKPYMDFPKMLGFRINQKEVARVLYKLDSPVTRFQAYRSIRLASSVVLGHQLRICLNLCIAAIFQSSQMSITLHQVRSCLKTSFIRVQGHTNAPS